MRNDPGQTDPLELFLPSICWIDWRDGLLYVSDEIGDLAVLERAG